MKHPGNRNRNSKSTGILVEKATGNFVHRDAGKSLHAYRVKFGNKIGFSGKILNGKAFSSLKKSNFIGRLSIVNNTNQLEILGTTITIDNSLNDFLLDPFILQNNQLAEKKLSKKRSKL